MLLAAGYRAFKNRDKSGSAPPPQQNGQASGQPQGQQAPVYNPSYNGQPPQGQAYGSQAAPQYQQNGVSPGGGNRR
ncbi:hypothetical protein MMC12_001267 [Toensbergia leucococca]|nr:hypothetical protein [Toensbergia leucococca]